MRLNEKLKASKKNEFFCSRIFLHIYRYIFLTYLLFALSKSIDFNYLTPALSHLFVSGG